MDQKLIILCCLLALTLWALTPLQAESGKFITEKVPLRVFGVIVAHGVGLGSALLLTGPDLLSRGSELGQSDVFAIYETQFLTGSGKSLADLTDLNLGWGKMLRPWLEGHAKVHLIAVQERDLDNAGASLDLGFRLLYPQKGDWRAFYDSGVGPCLTDKDFPAGGTTFNFMSSFGVGILHLIEPGLWWQAGFCHVHISNAGWIEGDGHNPGFDANGAYTGFVINY